MKSIKRAYKSAFEPAYRFLLSVICLTGVISTSVHAVAPSSPPGPLAETIKARQHLLGFDNVNPTTGAVRSDRVIFSWLTTTSFAVAANGKVFFFDTFVYLDQLVAPPARSRAPTTLQEMVDFRPDWIFLGHGHGDHADYAANIAYRTGATIFGAPEHCAAMQADAVRQFGAGKSVSCTALIPAGAAIGTQVNSIGVLKPALCLDVVRNLHGAASIPDMSIAPDSIDFLDGQDLRLNALYGTGPAVAPDAVTGGSNGVGGTLSILYHFTVPGSKAFSFTVFDTVGAIKEQAPNLIPILKNLPATDILFGAVSGADNPINGLRDPAIYVQNIQPRIFVPTHHEESQMIRGAAGGAGEYWKRKFYFSMQNIGIPANQYPEVRWLYDPHDYARPELLTFDPDSVRWTKTASRPNPVCN